MIGKNWLVVVAMLFLALNFVTACGSPDNMQLPAADSSRITLPEPKYDSDVSVEQALLKRRSIREYTTGALTLEEIAQLLWAAQGIMDTTGKRASPSAGGLYPLEVYVVVGKVKNVSVGVYKYRPHQHELLKVREGEQRNGLAQAALDQQCVKEGAIDIVITAVYSRTMRKYGDRGIRYVHMEAGHAAQNVYLQAVTMNLGTVTIGAFYNDKVKEVLNLPEDEEPLYIMPVGRKTTD